MLQYVYCGGFNEGAGQSQGPLAYSSLIVKASSDYDKEVWLGYDRLGANKPVHLDTAH